MIIDSISNLRHYIGIEEYTQKIQEFIARYEEEQLEDGRYEICGEQLFALVQTFTTKPCEEQRMESHKNYIDLQYVHQGKEAMYWDLVDRLEVEEDRTPDQDIVFYKKSTPFTRVVVEEKMFAYFLTHDAHRPGCQVDGPNEVTKIVFKIKIK